MDKAADKIREAQKLMRSGYWDVADDLLEQVLGKVAYMETELAKLRTEAKAFKATVRKMNKRIMEKTE